MLEKKFTEEGLPRVSEATIEVFFRDYFQRFREGEEAGMKMFKEMAERVNKDNPLIGKFFLRIYEDMSLENADEFVFGAGCMYEILRRQAEVYKL